jgi:hypothetical protein
MRPDRLLTATIDALHARGLAYAAAAVSAPYLDRTATL